jgi:hypothetical protein
MKQVIPRASGFKLTEFECGRTLRLQVIAGSRDTGLTKLRQYEICQYFKFAGALPVGGSSL